MKSHSEMHNANSGQYDQSTLPLVSVVMPAYNASRFVRRSIASVLSQDYPRLEIIAVNDGSTDDTEEVLQGFGDKITLISQKNGGVSAARNAGIGAAVGELIAFLDADDIWLPHKTRRQVEIMNQFPQLAMLGSACERIDADDKIFDRVEQTAPDGTPWLLTAPPVQDVSSLQQHLWGNCVGSASGMIVRKEALEQVGAFDATLYNGSEDWDLCMRLAIQYQVASCAEQLFHYRIAGTGLCGPENADRLLATDIQVLTKIFNMVPDEIAWLDRHRALSIRLLKAAQAYGEVNRTDAMRKMLWRAIVQYPPTIMRKAAIYMLMLSVLGKENLQRIKGK